MMAGVSLDELKQRLDDDAEALFRALWGEPTSRRQNELRWGRKGSLRLWLHGRKGPRWDDFEAGTGGDMLAAIQHALHLDFHGACDWARQFLGGYEPAYYPCRAARTGAKPLDYDVELERKRRQIAALVAAARPIGGTPAEQYLREHRGIEAKTWPKDVLWAPRAAVWRHLGWWWWKCPALLLCATDASGATTGVQLVALELDGRAALHWNGSGRKLKLSYGTLRNAAVRLPGGKRALLLAEGFETAASCWWATGLETWANLGSIAKARLEDVPLDQPIVICADDDARDAASNKTLRDAIRRWRREGRRVLFVKPHQLTRRDKSDFNDLLRAKGITAVRARILAALDAKPAGQPEVSQPLTQARALLRRLMDQEFAELLAWRGDDEEAAPFRVLRVGTGLGKTDAAIRQAAAAAGAKIVYPVPTHRLGAELANRFAVEAQRQGVAVPVAIWRGRGAAHPDFPTETMCAELKTVETAQQALLDVGETVCNVCPSAPACPYLAQQQQVASIWIAAHEVLFHSPPAPMAGADLLIIDEGFALRGLKGISGPALQLTEAELTAVPLLKSAAAEADIRALLMPLRQKLLDVLRVHAEGGLKRQVLLDAGLTVEAAREAAKLEWRAKSDVSTTGLTWPSVREAVAKAAKRNRLIPRLAMMWQAIAELLAEDGPAVSGRAVIEQAELDGSTVRMLRFFGAEPVAAGWRRVPALNIDATADMTLLRARVPHAELAGAIEAAAPHMRIVQYPDRAFGKVALCNERTLFRAYDWAIAYASRQGGSWAFIMPKAAEEKVTARDTVPNFIQLHHFGALRGLDTLRDVRGVIIFGRPMPPPVEVERTAGALSGGSVAAVTGDWYPAETVQLHSRDGAVMTVEADRHPDELAEAVRAHICEAELLQAIGRARGLNRTAENPVEVVLLTNVPIAGLVPDELRQWEGPRINDELLAQHGAVLASAGDAAQVAGVTRKAVKNRRKRMAPFPYKNSLYENGANLRQAEYQRVGPGRSRQLVVFDARRIPDCRTWLEGQLGPLAHYLELPPAETVREGARAALGPIERGELPAAVHNYRGGILPPAGSAWVRDRRRASGLSQEQVARRIGLSRPQLANAEAGRFGLSPAAAARLLSTVSGLDQRQASLF